MLFVFRILVLSFLAAAMAPAVAASLTSANTEKSGIPLRWRAAKVTVAVSSSFSSNNSSIKPGSDVEGAIARSIARWERATGIEFEVVSSEKTSVSPTGPAGDGVSLLTIAASQANLSVFPAGSSDVPATTRIFFSRQGFISEADIILNPTQVFSTDGTFGTFDLEAVLVHEFGHLLGLEHAAVSGAIMYRSQARNGHFASPAPLRELSQADLAAARSLYGSIDPDIECCFAIDAAADLGAEKGSSIFWAEESETGRVVSASAARTDRARTPLEGLVPGAYNVFAQGSGNGSTVSSFLPVQIDAAGRERTARTIPNAGSAPIELEFVGINGQLSKMPLVLETGRTHSILVGGRGLDPNTVTIGSTSQSITVISGSTRKHDYGEKFDVVSVEVAIDADALAGSYTLSATDRRGRTVYYPAAIILPER